MTEQLPFWPQAWALEAQVTTPDPDARRMAAEALHDLLLQAFLLDFKRWEDADLLPSLIQAGVAAAPPSEESGWRHWPFLDYLRRVAPAVPHQALEALSAVVTRNATVLEQALEVALEVPELPTTPTVVRLTQLWLDADPRYFDSRLWALVANELLGQAEDARQLLGALLVQATARGTTYELEQFLLSLQESDSPVLLDAIESALLFVLSAKGSRWQAMRLADLDDDRDEPAAVLLGAWLRRLPNSSWLPLRAGRLVDHSHPWVRQMGVRALRLGLQAGEGRTAGLDLLRSLLRDDQRLRDYVERDELLELLAAHAELLDGDEQAALLQGAAAQAASPDRLARYEARDILGAMRNLLGPVERTALKHLEKELGPYSPGKTFSVTSFWMGPESPLSPEALRSMKATELLALMRHTPGPEAGEHWGPSIEGLAVQLKEEVPRRAEEFLRLMVDHGDSVDEPAVHAAVLEGLSRAFVGGSLDDDVKYMALVGRTLNRFAEDEAATYARRAIGWSLLAVTEAQGKAGAVGLPEVLRQLLRDSDPQAYEPQELGGDIRTQALNVNRGVAVRACMRWLFVALDEQLSGIDTMEEDLASVLAEERHPAVLLTFGMYLPLAYQRTTRLKQVYEARLAAGADDWAAWSAVLAGYVGSHRPSYFDRELLAEYATAVAERPVHEASALEAVFSDLLVHILSNYLFSDDASVWEPLLAPTLDVASAEERAQAFRNLSRGLRRADGTVVVQSTVLRFASLRAGALRGRPDAAVEASALLDLVIALDAEVTSSAGVLLDLMRLGATPRDRDLLPYLRRESQRSPYLSALILEAFIGSEVESWVWRSELDALLDIIGSLEGNGVEGLQLGRRLADTFGRQRIFGVEPAARAVYGPQAASGT